MTAQLSDRDYEQLSAYIDGQLSPQEQHKLEERLHARPELQDALNEISRTRSLLRTAPRRKAPRNFTLTPEMVGQGRSAKRQRSTWNLFPALSFASALAAFALVASLVFELMPGQALSRSAAPGQGNLTAEGVPAMKAQPTTEAAAPAAPAVRMSDHTATSPAENATQPAGAPAIAAAPLAAQPTATAEPVAAGGETPQQGLAASPAEKSTPQDQSQFGPPVISWNGSPAFGQSGPAYGMGGGGGGGGGGPSMGPLLGPPEAPNTTYGVGGGAGGAGGAASSEPSGQIVVPQEGMNSLETESTVVPTTPAQPNPDIQGTGPILGVPPTTEGGQIIDQKSIIGQVEPNAAGGAGASNATGAPDATGVAGTAPAVGTAEAAGTASAVGAVPQPAPAVENQPQADQPAAPRTLLGLPVLAFVQVLLAIIAIATGVSAYLLHRALNR